MVDVFVLSEEFAKLQDTTYLFPNEVSINVLEEREIERLLNGKVLNILIVSKFLHKSYIELT